jgi:TLD
MGPTLTTIMSSDGYLFGGYIRTSISHDSPPNTEKHLLHAHSFLFTLSNPHAISPTKYPLRAGLYYNTLYTPTKHVHLGWGWLGYDIELSQNPQKDNKSYCNFPYAFNDITGKGKLTFTGTEYFNVRDVEVYAVVPSYISSLKV